MKYTETVEMLWREHSTQTTIEKSATVIQLITEPRTYFLPGVLIEHLKQHGMFSSLRPSDASMRP